MKPLVTAAGATAAALTLAVFAFAASPPPVPQIQWAETQWVAQSLTQMQTVRVGMTRAQLLRVFEPANGTSSREDGRFTYRVCPNFVVHVLFRPVGKEARNEWGSPADKITAISQPVVAQNSAYIFVGPPPVPQGGGGR